MSSSSHYAGFWMRFVAVVIDGFILSILQNLIIFPVLGLFGLSFMAGFSDFNPMMLEEEEILEMLPALMGAIGGIMAISGLVSILYYAIMESGKYQATLGKMALGIQVTDENGNGLSFFKSVIRQIGKYFSGCFLMIGYIMAAFTSKKQALHDMMAGALVVKK